MTRIIAGSARGRRLRTPSGDATRPTSDRVREALFSALESRLGSLHGLRVLDLYAGSGAVALEAVSRGAAAATAVESDRRTATLIGENARTVGLASQVQVLAQSVDRALARPPAEPFDVVFADPPYPLATTAVEQVLTLLLEGGWLTEDALVVVERSARSPEPAWPDGLALDARKHYGETVLWYVSRRLDRGEPGSAVPPASEPEMRSTT